MARSSRRRVSFRFINGRDEVCYHVLDEQGERETFRFQDELSAA